MRRAAPTLAAVRADFAKDDGRRRAARQARVDAPAGYGRIGAACVPHD